MNVINYKAPRGHYNESVIKCDMYVKCNIILTIM